MGGAVGARVGTLQDSVHVGGCGAAARTRSSSGGCRRGPGLGGDAVEGTAAGGFGRLYGRQQRGSGSGGERGAWQQ